MIYTLFSFQRKATLLQEYKVKDKSNKFLDRRIGERNSAMTAEDKMTARFTAERMRAQSRVSDCTTYSFAMFFSRGHFLFHSPCFSMCFQKAMFNLADDEVLTHRGQTLNEIEKFDDPRSDDEDDQDDPFKSKGNLDGDVLHSFTETFICILPYHVR